MKVFLLYVRKENRTTYYYDVGAIWCLHIKKPLYKIVWNKWFLNRRIVLCILKNN